MSTPLATQNKHQMVLVGLDDVISSDKTDYRYHIQLK